MKLDGGYKLRCPMHALARMNIHRILSGSWYLHRYVYLYDCLCKFIYRHGIAVWHVRLLVFIVSLSVCGFMSTLSLFSKQRLRLRGGWPFSIELVWFAKFV